MFPKVYVFHNPLSPIDLQLIAFFRMNGTEFAYIKYGFIMFFDILGHIGGVGVEIFEKNFASLVAGLWSLVAGQRSCEF